MLCDDKKIKIDKKKTDAYNYGQSKRERSVSIWISWWNP